MGSLHWCFHCSYSTHLCPTTITNDQLNILSASVMSLLRQVEELKSSASQLDKACTDCSNAIAEMLSDDHAMAELLKGENSSDTASDYNEDQLFDECPQLVESRLLDDLHSIQNTNSEEAEIVSSHLDSQLHVIVARDTIPKSVPLFLPKSEGQKLDMVFGCKVFDIEPERDISTAYRGPRATIGSLPHALGLYICNWFDTEQVLRVCFDRVKSGELLSITTTHKVFADMSGRYTYAYSFDLGSTKRCPEFGRDLLIIDGIISMHKIAFLHLQFDPGVYVVRDLPTYSCEICNYIRSDKHIAIPLLKSTGCIILLEERGSVFTFQGPERNGFKISVCVPVTQFYWKVSTQVKLGLAAASSHGEISFVATCDNLLHLLMIFVSNSNVKASDFSVALSSYTYFTRHVLDQKTVTYDLCNELFSLFLDETVSYSGAIFKSEDEDLKIVQLTKCSLLVEKSKFSMPYHIVEIGFGRGSLSMEHDKKPRYPNTDINLTVQQLKFWDLVGSIQWPNMGRVFAEHNYDCGHFLLVCPYDKLGAFSYLRDVCTTAELFNQYDFDATEISTNIEGPTIFKEFWIGLDNLKPILKLVPVNFPDLALSPMKSGVISSTSHVNRYLVAKYAKESSKQLATRLIYLEEEFAAKKNLIKVLTETKEIMACRGLAMRSAMIAVLAYFIASKCQTTKVAGLITIGFNVMCIITECTVAAIAYGLDKNASKEKVGLSGVQESLLIAAANACSKQLTLVLMCGSPQATSLAEVLNAMVEPMSCANYHSWRVYVPKGELFSSIGSTEFFTYLEKFTGPDLVKEWRKLLDPIFSMLGGVMTLPPLSIQVTYGVYIAPCCVKSEIFNATVLHDDLVQGIKSHIVIYTNLVHTICNEYKVLEADFVLGAGRIWLKLVEKVAAPWRTSWIAKNLQVPMPSTNNSLEELDPIINNVLKSKLHKLFNVGPSALPSSSPKKLVGVNRVRGGCILWFEKQKESFSFEVALGKETLEEFLWVVNTDKEEHDNTVVSVRPYSNLEDKVLIEGGRIVTNLTKLEGLFVKMSNYNWDPGKMPIYRRGL